MVEPYTIERLEEKDIESLFEFRQRVFPVNNKQMNRERWRWLFLNNPYAGASLPIWVIKTQDRIAGSICALPALFNIGRKVFWGCFGTDYYVEGCFKGQPALQLIRRIKAYSPLLIGANVSDSAHQLLLRMGCSDLSSEIYEATISLSRPGRMLARLTQTLRKCARNIIVMSARGIGYQTMISNYLPEDYHLFWSSLADGRYCGLDKNTTYMRWRYEKCPTLDHSFVLCRRHNSICAIIVVGIRNNNHNRTGLILDILVKGCNPMDLLPALCAGLEYFTEQNCKFVTLHWTAHWAKPFFRLFGFNLRTSDLGLLVWVAKGSEHLKALQQPGRWKFSLGDSDRF